MFDRHYIADSVDPLFYSLLIPFKLSFRVCLIAIRVQNFEQVVFATSTYLETAGREKSSEFCWISLDESDVVFFYQGLEAKHREHHMPLLEKPSNRH